MLQNVTQAVSKASRQLTLKHPNRWLARLYRFSKDMKNEGVTENQDDNLWREIDSDDEPRTEYIFLGEVALLKCGSFEASNLVDSFEGVDYQNDTFQATIEFVENAILKSEKHDIVYVTLCEGVAIAYEVIGVEAKLDIPPYCYVYVLAKRDDLLYVEALQSK